MIAWLRRLYRRVFPYSVGGAGVRGLFRPGGLGEVGPRDGEVVAMLTPATIVAPFPPAVVEALRAWQQCPWVHPLTCGGFGCEWRGPLLVIEDGLYCEKCGTLHEASPAVCVGPLPPSPREVLGLPPEEN